MLNPLGYCQIGVDRGGQRMTCQQPLCVRSGRVECEEGHPQPDHPLQRQVDEAKKALPPTPACLPEPAVASYVPEPTWAVQARQTDALKERIASLEARVAVMEANQIPGRSRKAG